VHLDLSVGKLEIKFNGYAFSASKTESNVGYIMSKNCAKFGRSHHIFGSGEFRHFNFRSANRS